MKLTDDALRLQIHFTDALLELFRALCRYEASNRGDGSDTVETEDVKEAIAYILDDLEEGQRSFARTEIEKLRSRFT